jgi:hypothetical protein
MSSGDLKYGNTTDEMVSVSTSNFAGAGVLGFSMCTTPIEVIANGGSDEILAHATAFFWLRKGQPYLLTNYHVISGRNAFTGQLDAKTAFVPRKLRFHSLSSSVSGGIVHSSAGTPGRGQRSWSFSRRMRNKDGTKRSASI